MAGWEDLSTLIWDGKLKRIKSIRAVIFLTLGIAKKFKVVSDRLWIKQRKIEGI